MSKVFIVRFHVIQFTRYSVVRSRPLSVRCELLYVSTSYSVCQELFSNFLRNFFKLWLSSRKFPFIGQLLYTSILNRICQDLFISFHKILLFLLVFRCCLKDSLHILAFSKPFVKHFFTIFRHFYFRISVLRRALLVEIVCPSVADRNVPADARKGICGIIYCLF